MITSRQNPLVRHVKLLGGDRKYRYERGEFVCAGTRCLADAVGCGAEITAVLAARGDVCAGLPATLVNADVLAYASPLKTTGDDGVVFAVRMPTRVAEPRGRCVVLDGVQDPGNVGAVIRSAAAFGFGVLLVNGCADPYNVKAVRASMGAIFRVRVAETDIAALGALTLVGAATDGAVSVRDADLRNASIAVGGEGAGLSHSVLSLCRERVRIPMAPGVESLNAAVAASVLMYAADLSELRIKN